MGDSRKELPIHSVRYTLVYANGWENGSYMTKTTSANPSVCARMILVRFGSGNIVGVRISSIDGERVDYLSLP